jgi:hypothetical protein
VEQASTHGGQRGHATVTCQAYHRGPNVGTHVVHTVLTRPAPAAPVAVGVDAGLVAHLPTLDVAADRDDLPGELVAHGDSDLKVGRCGVQVAAADAAEVHL